MKPFRVAGVGVGGVVIVKDDEEGCGHDSVGVVVGMGVVVSVRRSSAVTCAVLLSRPDHPPPAAPPASYPQPVLCQLETPRR